MPEEGESEPQLFKRPSSRGRGGPADGGFSVTVVVGGAIRLVEEHGLPEGAVADIVEAVVGALEGLFLVSVYIIH